jgi:hypothetical protein
MKRILKGLFCPGELFPMSRAFYFFLFLVVTIAQTYCSLLMEEQLTEEVKFVET